jgi:hypothetical protein
MYAYTMSQHAQYRSAQRNLSNDDIHFILLHGKYEHRAGVLFCQLHRKDIPNDTPGNHRHRQLIGTTVVLCRCGGYVVTVYREEKAFHKDNCKTPYDRQIDQQLKNCPCCHASDAA